MNTPSKHLARVILCSCALALGSCKTTGDAKASDGGSALATAGTTAGGEGGAGATAGAGGNAGNGGTAGSAAAHDAGSDDPLDDGGAAACTPCIGATLGWGPNGGFVAYTDHSELMQCNGYRHTRTPSGRAPTTAVLECKRELPCMGSGLHGISDVLHALEHPDVVAARKQAMVLYGNDTRPVDGTVFRIELPGSIIDVGNPCAAGGGACVAIPPGIAELRSLLESLDGEQLGIEPCKTTFE